jgi:cysteine/O-acetylserine efflux protein
MFNLAQFLIYIFVTAYTPGPNNIMSLGNAIRFGYRKMFPFTLGILAGFSIIMQFCTLLSAVLYAFISQARLILQIIGAGYMLYLAWKTWKSSSEIELKETQGASFASGFALQFVNPKIYIYGITAMSTFVFPHFDSIFVWVGFALFLAFIGFTGTVAWAIFGSVFCKLLSKYAKIINPVLALLLVYCAVSLFFE